MKAIILVAATVLTSLSFASETFKIDTGHSAVSFAVSHMQVSTAKGRFNDFEGTVVYSADNPAQSKFEMTIKIESVDTASERRDKHLRSPDFFNAKQFPTATFTSTKVEKNGEGLKITGDFTLMGITKSISFDVPRIATGANPRGEKLLGFDAQTVIKRSDFGMNTYLKEGAIGDEVILEINVEAGV